MTKESIELSIKKLKDRIKSIDTKTRAGKDFCKILEFELYGLILEHNNLKAAEKVKNTIRNIENYENRRN